MTLRLINTLLLTLSLTSVLAHEEILPIDFTPEEKAWIKAHPTVSFGYEPNWEPYEIYTHGEYTGIMGEYVKKIEAATGIDMIPVKDITWEQSLEQLRNGELHVIPSCAITKERRKYLAFTDVYLSDPLIIATNRDFEFVGSLNDLKGKRVVLPKNYYTVEMLNEDYPGIEIIKVNTIRECLEYLSYGKADAFVGSLGVVSYYINHKGFTNIKIAAPTRYKDTKIAFAVTKDWLIFRDIVQKVLNQISVKEHNEIRKKWISVRYEYGFSWDKALRYFFLFLVLVSIGYIIFYLWNRSLKKQIRLKEKMQERLQKSLERIQKQDQEKKVLLQEIHHRVKNNLQVIISMLRLQIHSQNDENAILSLQEAIDRINAIALIHEKVYQSDELREISSEEYIRALAEEIISNFSQDKKITLKIEAPGVYLDLDSSLPVALIINELITNSIKHGFKNRTEGQISIRLQTKNEFLFMQYEDNGAWLESKNKNSLGTTLIETFTEQMNGKISLEKSEKGTVYQFEFTLEKK